jgi:hypothetical protein
MNLYKFILVALLSSPLGRTQENNSIEQDSSRLNPFQFHMCFDWYYAINLSDSKTDALPFFVSFAHNRELQHNLIYADLKWESKRYRIHAVPAVGTFMEQNSVSEKGIFKNVLEANAGFKLSRSKNIWIDAGVLGSPYTNENPYSQEHLTLTRTLAAEYVPYYLAGARASWQINSRWKTCLFLLNGWQQINDINDKKSLGTQVEYKPSDRDLINWNTYIGQEGFSDQLNYGMRYFTDVFWTHGFTKKISFSSCTYVGIQKNSHKESSFWWQTNGTIRYSLKKYGSISGRMEYFYDPHNAVVAPQISGIGFQCFAYSVGYSYHLLKSMLLRVEYRRLNGVQGHLYINSAGALEQQLNMLTGALTFWI